jgi:hypothetical protein
MPENILLPEEEFNLLLPEDLSLDTVVLTPDLKAKSAKDQRDNLEVVCSHDSTYIILVAVHKDGTRNVLNKISCKKGLPIGGYLYDSVSDCYQISCADYVQIGYIPASMILRVGGVENWQVRIPLAESVIKRFLTSTQKKDIKNFRAIYKSDEFTIQYVQLLDCH